MEKKTKGKESSEKVEKERVQFKELMIKNPNYFGTCPEIKIKPVLPMKTNTKYEELRCLGFYPEQDLLEATLDVKLPYGYGGNLCSPGSFEYVRLFVDWNGDGDFTDAGDDVGIASVNVHDIPNEKAACLEETKPLSYVLGVKIDSKKRVCTHPNIVKVRAILSWNVPPPPGNPNYPPVWGNVVERMIQIRPAKFILKDMIKLVDLEKLKIDSEMLDLETTVSKAKALTPAELKEIYKGKNVPEHRFNLADVQKIAETVKLDPNLMEKYKLDPKLIEIIESVDPILAAKPDTRYEELHCLGLNYELDTLVATLTVKLPYGYSGDLCTQGSYEFVAFWAYVWDPIEEVCHWKYLGTSSVNVHDIKSIPPEGLQYAVYLPVDLSGLRDKCNRPKIMRVRAILSWQTPPSPGNPEYSPVWGNTIDRLIQIKPGMAVGPEKQIPFITVVGGMAINKISGNSETVIPSAIGDGYANGVNALESPFGGVLSICGHISNPPNDPVEADKLKYRPQYKKSGEMIWHDITNQFRIYISTWNGVTWSQSPKDQVAVGGYYKYEEDLTPPVQRFVDASDYSGGSVLADWHTPVPEGDGLYEIRVLLYQLGASPSPGVPADHVSSNVIQVMIDNTAPKAEVSIDAGPCENFTPGKVIKGKFKATDQHIWQYRFSLMPYAAPSSQFSHDPVAEDYPALPAPGVTGIVPPDGTFLLDTSKMAPCGYVLYLYVWDRAIVNNYMQGNQNSASVGFCLLKG